MPESSANSLTYPLNWAYVKPPQASARIKQNLDDFVVEEQLGFEPSGEGEHVFLHIEKAGLNTNDVMRHLAKVLLIHPKHISYAGLKDKHALTRQWMSIWTKKAILPEMVETEQIRVLEVTRHTQKLKRGAHKANDFIITLRDVKNVKMLEANLKRISEKGAPNYFGPQRFGENAQNVLKAEQMFSGKVQPGRHLRGLYLSAARAYLYNAVLSERVAAGNWNSLLTGEAVVLNGSHSFFKAEINDERLTERLKDFDIHPSAPMWGAGDLPSFDAAKALEERVTDQFPALTRGLEAAGLKQQRRATRLLGQSPDLQQLDATTWQIQFRLEKGAFATTVLRELIQFA